VARPSRGGDDGAMKNTLRRAAHVAPLLLLALGCSGGEEPAPTPADDAENEADGGGEEDDPVEMLEAMKDLVSPAEHARFVEDRGLVAATDGATPGLTLVMPLNSTDIHLVDEAAEIVHTWETDLSPGGWAYLMDDGTLYRSARNDDDPKFRGGGIGGILQRIAPDGEVLWSFRFADDEHCQHHDIEVLPGGDVLFIAWERKSAEQAIAAGRDPRGVGEAGLWAASVWQVRPVGKDDAEVVWSWHAWDHLVQDVDPDKPNHGDIAAHRHRFDVNVNFEPPEEIDEEERRAREERKRQMAALGYGGGEEEEEEDDDDAPRPKDWDRSGDWMHTNAIDHHPALDLIVLSSPELGEIYVIDHSTTREEASGSTGGRFGRGGDVLWRWGNPQNYRAGGENDQRLFYQHDPRWLPGDDVRLTVFNNGGRRPDGSSYSEVLELALPFEGGAFVAPEEGPFGPEEPAWSYSDPETFFSAFISGAARLASGNTLVCSGVVGRIFEVTPDGEIVWDYYSPHGGDVEPPEHAGKAPPYALYRCDRYPRDHPGVAALGIE